MLNFRRNKGITLISLVATVIILFILAGVSITSGFGLIKQIKAEGFTTNMISVKAKAKVIAEEVNAQVWDIGDSTEKANKKRELYKSNYGMEEATISTEAENQIDSTVGSKNEKYLITLQTLEKMSLEDIGDGENYVIVYNSDDYTKLDIIYKKGITYDGTVYYSLSRLQAEIQNKE